MSFFNLRTAIAFSSAATILLLSIAIVGQPRSSVPSLYQESYDLEAVGDYSGALAALESMPRSEQSSFIFLLRSGWLLYLQGDYESAIGAYVGAIEADPDALEARIGIQLPQTALRLWQDVERSTRSVLSRDPMNYVSRRRLALALYSMGRYVEAEEVYRGVLEQYPSDVEVASGLGWALYMQGDSSGAARVFEHVVWISPNHAGLPDAEARLID